MIKKRFVYALFALSALAFNGCEAKHGGLGDTKAQFDEDYGMSWEEPKGRFNYRHNDQPFPEVTATFDHDKAFMVSYSYLPSVEEYKDFDFKKFHFSYSDLTRLLNKNGLSQTDLEPPIIIPTQETIL